MKTVGFFSSKGGIGKTTLVYHLASMYQELGIGTVAIDLDPQADLTTAFLSEDGVLDLMGQTEPVLLELGEHLALLPGSPTLDVASAWVSWQGSAEEKTTHYFVTSFSHQAREAARTRNAEIVLIDVAPGLSAINRAAFLACDAVVISLSSSLVSFWGLPTLGMTLRQWRSEWRKQGVQDPSSGKMEDIGYVLLQHASSPDQDLSQSILNTYHRSVLGAPQEVPIPSPDPYHLATLKRYPSLMSLARDARKPMFLLKPADGAIGSHVEAVRDCYRDFKQLALRIASACA